jgi:hypothetical protein
MPIKLLIFTTELTEKELFLKLLKRGRHADISYYFSVDSFNWEEGWVVFVRLDCAPAPEFRVAVAGHLLIVSAKDLSEISQWFAEWQLNCHLLKEELAETPQAAHALLKELREQAPCARDRTETGKEVANEITAFNQAADRDLMARCGGG